MGLFGRNDADDADDAATAGDDREDSPEVTVEVGAPGRCPVCHGFGYIDHIDMINRIQMQHCRDCRHRWEFSFDEDGVVIDLRDDVVDTTSVSPRQQLRS